ncbi:response regulator receiver protein [Actinomadura miaoliensis]|uniref:Response regulator receiver protein n=1 Tax=Actinomadura miaoliensis TaxID=430685 RepID=A0ABP7W6U5_9ACTN
MSSGVEADIALDAAVVLTLGMNRALGRAAGVAGRGAEALAALAAGKAEERAAALAAVEAYERALRKVLERNARIAALAETRERLKADVALPQPLQPDEQDIAELDAWCAAADTALDEAEARLSHHLASEIGAQIFPRAATSLRTELGPSGERPTQGETRPAQAEAVRQRLERVVGRLLPDVSAEDRRAVAEAAALLPGASGEEEAEGVLTEVRLRVQAANARTRQRREEERRRAAEREAAEQAEAERRYVLDSITSAFQDLGYEVQAGFETLTAAGGEVVLTRGSWPDHGVRMRMDDAAQIRAAMVRTRPAESEDDRRLDVEREREWCEAFEAARARLADAGVRSEVTWRLEPGVKELPVTDRARQTGARTAAPRERRRERG